MHWQIFVNNIVFLFIIMADDYAVKSVTMIFMLWGKQQTWHLDESCAITSDYRVHTCRITK